MDFNQHFDSHKTQLFHLMDCVSIKINEFND